MKTMRDILNETKATFYKSDLIFKDYSWKVYGDDDPEITGKPDSTLFNRNEGYEVLYLIN